MRVSLMDVHGALSRVVFAVSDNLKPLWVDVSAQWQNFAYLSIRIECRGKDVQKVVDRLTHGVLQAEYDYRFTCSYPTRPDPEDWVVVTAYPNLQHDDRVVNGR